MLKYSEFKKSKLAYICCCFLVKLIANMISGFGFHLIGLCLTSALCCFSVTVSISCVIVKLI